VPLVQIAPFPQLVPSEAFDHAVVLVPGRHTSQPLLAVALGE
jgi:hypothetical protein